MALSADSRRHVQWVGPRDMEGGDCWGAWGWAPKRLRGGDLMDTWWVRKHRAELALDRTFQRGIFEDLDI